MKTLKQILSLGLVIALCVCLLPANAHAAGKNVTASMKKDKNLQELIDGIAICTTSMLCERAGTKQSKKTVKEPLKGYNALSIAANVAHQNHENYFTKKDIHKWTYDLFGIKPNIKSIPSYPSYETKKRIWISKSIETSASHKPYQYCGGDWGIYKPLYTIKKIVKVKKNVYDVTITNKLGSRETPEVKNVGTTYMRVKKNSKSAYKYKITSLKHKGNGIGY